MHAIVTRRDGAPIPSNREDAIRGRESALEAPRLKNFLRSIFFAMFVTSMLDP